MSRSPEGASARAKFAGVGPAELGFGRDTLQPALLDVAEPDFEALGGSGRAAWDLEIRLPHIEERRLQWVFSDCELCEA